MVCQRMCARGVTHRHTELMRTFANVQSGDRDGEAESGPAVSGVRAPPQ